MKGHTLNRYGKEVIYRLKELTQKLEDSIKEGKQMKKDGYVYENYELKKKEVNK